MTFIQIDADCLSPTRPASHHHVQDGELLVRIRYIAEVVASKSENFKAGDLIEGHASLEEFNVLEARKVRRLGGPDKRILCYEKISVSVDTMQVSYAGQAVELTKKEYLLLKLLMENPEKVYSRDELLDLVWGYDCYPVTRTVDNHILHLRKKLAEHLFETVRGVGYRLTSGRREAAFG